MAGGHGSGTGKNHALNKRLGTLTSFPGITTDPSAHLSHKETEAEVFDEAWQGSGSHTEDKSVQAFKVILTDL